MFGQKFGGNTNSILEVQGDEAIRGSRSWSFTNAEGYRMGRYVAAFALDELSKGNTKPLWQRDDLLAPAHNGLRVTDLNGDGRDEIISGCVLAPDGSEIFRLPNVSGHLDSIFIADVRPADWKEKGAEKP